MPLDNRIFKNLKKITGAQYCTRAKEDLACYAYDATKKEYFPDAVVFPKDTDEVSAILKLACKHKFYVIPRGYGSGMTGGSLAVRGGVVLVMTRFNRICKIDKENLIAIVEPGVVTGNFHRAVEKEGLFYPPDPSSSDFSTLGGNLAECAGGPRAVKYGVTRDYVLGLEVVIPTGEKITTGVKTAKGVVGYDLTRLMVGSEGTLGIITCMTLRLLPLPETVKTLLAVFKKIETAAETVSKIIRQRIIPRAIEFMDKSAIKCVQNYAKTALPVNGEAVLIIQVDGTEKQTSADINLLKDLCISKGAISVKLAENEVDTANLWKARKAISPALYTYGPDKINEDIVVPRSKIPEMVKKINYLRDKTGLTMVSFGHAGDGNIHFNVMLDKKDSKQMTKAKSAVEEVFDYTLELGGTISGEHGVGITKSEYIAKEIGHVEILIMKKIKEVFDPHGILNPGKIFVQGG